MKILLFANTDWYLFNFRRSLAQSLKDEGNDVVLLSPDGPYGLKLRELGFRWIPVPLQRRSLNPFTECGFIFSLVRLLRREKPDVIHSFTLKCAVYGALAARVARVPFRVSAVTGLGYVFSSGDVLAGVLRPIVRAVLHFALDGPGSRLVLQNRDDLAFFVSSGMVASEQVRLIAGSGVDLDSFYPTVMRGQKSSLSVLLPARVLWDKGIAEFIAAARIVKGSGRSVEFFIAGSPDPGNPAAVPVETIESWVGEGLVTWHGHVDDMPQLFSCVDIVALPSYREGLPKGLIEAGASGCALVTTDVPGCREVVSDGVDGLLVAPRDPVALADAIARLDDDRVLLRRLATAASSKARALFDVRIINRLTLDVYREFEGSLPVCSRDLP